jgi:hypothetical protein
MKLRLELDRGMFYGERNEVAIRRVFGADAKRQHLVPIVIQGQLHPSLLAIAKDAVDVNMAGAALEVELLTVEDVKDPVRSLPHHDSY